jgi:hypothetical protein
MRRTSAEPGFAPPNERPLGRERRGIALAELMATLGLTLAMIVALGVIGVGIARADCSGLSIATTAAASASPSSRVWSSPGWAG